MIFPGSPVEIPPADALARIAPGARVLTTRTADGLVLRAAWIRGGDPAGPVLVYFHGNAESAAENLPLAVDLAGRANCDVVLAEYRGYGREPGEPSERGLYADGEAVLAALAAEGVAADRIVLVGRSLGSGVAVELASRGHGRRLILVSPYTSMAAMGSRVVGPLASVLIEDRFDSLSKITGVKVPITILHGEEDDVVPFAMGKRLAEVSGASFVAIPGRGHNDLDDLPERIARAL